MGPSIYTAIVIFTAFLGIPILLYLVMISLPRWWLVVSVGLFLCLFLSAALYQAKGREEENARLDIDWDLDVSMFTMSLLFVRTGVVARLLTLAMKACGYGIGWRLVVHVLGLVWFFAYLYLQHILRS